MLAKITTFFGKDVTRKISEGDKNFNGQIATAIKFVNQLSVYLLCPIFSNPLGDIEYYIQSFSDLFYPTKNDPNGIHARMLAAFKQSGRIEATIVFNPMLSSTKVIVRVMFYPPKAKKPIYCLGVAIEPGGAVASVFGHVEDGAVKKS